MKSIYAVTLAVMLTVFSYVAGARAQDSVQEVPLEREIQNTNSFKCIEVYNASHSNGARVQQNPCRTQLHQMFHVVPTNLGDQTVKIVASHSRHCLQVSSRERNAKLVQNRCITGRRSQAFIIRRYGIPHFEHYRWIVSAYSSQCVAVDAPFTRNNQQIVQRPCSPNSDQLWVGFFDE